MSIQSILFNILKIQDPKLLYKINKYKKEYIKLYPECAICGETKNLECHHVIPVHIDQYLSTNSNNFITLCDNGNKGCHNHFGHFQDFRNKYNKNIKELAIFIRLHIIKNDPIKEWKVNTDKLIIDFADSMKISKEEFMVRVENLTK